MTTKSKFDFDRNLQYFRAIPWTHALLSDPLYITIPTPSRTPKVSTEDALVAQTLHTPSTIANWLTLIPHQCFPSSSTLTAPIVSALFLLHLSHGINGFPGTAHGGITSVIIDECMGILLWLNADRGIIEKGVVTAWAKTEYVRKLETPGEVLVRVQMGKREGRKIWMKASVEGEGRRKLARGEALWIVQKKQRARL